MARCWTCGAYIERPLFECPNCRTVEEIQKLRNETAENFDELAEVQRRGFEKLSSRLSEGLSNIASAIEWGFRQLRWELELQTQVLKSIDRTLKTPTQTQANEWRQIAEDLKSREVLDKSEEFFQKSLDANPLDYRTYVGLAETYLQMDEFEKAEDILEESIPHAPKGSSLSSDISENVRRLLREGKKIPAIKAYREETGTSLMEAKNIIEAYEVSGEDLDSMSAEELLKYVESLEWENDSEEGESGNYSETSEIFDYRSYSYRLIGHIYACREDYSQAVSVLQTAVELSPNYYIAFYDLAKYSAQTGQSEICISALKKAIEAEPFFFELAEKDYDFSSVRDVIEDIEEGAQRVARQGIRDAEAAIKKAEEVGAKDYASTKYQKSVSELRAAKSKIAEATYRAFVAAERLSSKAISIANQSKEETEQKKEIEAEKERALKKELKSKRRSLIWQILAMLACLIVFPLIPLLGGAPEGVVPVLVGWLIVLCPAFIWAIATYFKKAKRLKEIEELHKAD